MSSFGMGIGDFMSGLASGIRSGQAIAARNRSYELDERRLQLLEEEARRKADDDVFERDYKNKQMRLYENSDARAAEADKRASAKSELELKALRDSQSEYDANAPLREATRQSGILEQQGKLKDQRVNQEISDIRQSGLNDYEGTKSKAILQGTDEAGKPTYSVDDKKYGSKEEAERAFEEQHPFWAHFNQNGGRQKMVDKLIAAGKYQEADIADKFFSDKRTANGFQQTGKVLQSMEIGDIAGVNKHLKELLNDPHYLVKDGYDITSDFIKDEKGNALKDKEGNYAGLKLTMKNRQTGEVFEQSAVGTQDVINKFSWIINPENAVAWNLKQTELARAQQAKAAEKGIDTGSDITKDAYKQQFELRRKLDDLDAPEWAKTMTPEQKDAYVQGRLKSILDPSSIARPSGPNQPRTFSYGR